MRAIGLLVVMLVGACKDVTNIKPTMTFADRSDAEITRLVIAGLGGEGFAAQDSFDGLQLDPTPTCPAVVLAGDTMTVTSDCATASGTEVLGSIVVTNPISWPGYHWDNGRDTPYVFDQFTLIVGAHTTSYDGVYTQAGNAAAHAMDITVELDGVAVRSNLVIDTTQRYESFSGGVELVGVGGALVSGSHDDAYLDANHYQLEGTDTVEIDETPDGAVSWQLAGTGRSCMRVGIDCQ